MTTEIHTITFTDRGVPNGGWVKYQMSPRKSCPKDTLIVEIHYDDEDSVSMRNPMTYDDWEKFNKKHKINKKTTNVLKLVEYQEPTLNREWTHCCNKMHFKGTIQYITVPKDCPSEMPEGFELCSSCWGEYVVEPQWSGKTYKTTDGKSVCWRNGKWIPSNQFL